MKTLAEWKAYYEKKTGYPVDEKPYATTLFDEKKGFMVYFINKENLIACEIAGDGKYWEEKAFEIARQQACKQIFTSIYANSRAFMKRYPNSKIYGTIMKWEVD